MTETVSTLRGPMLQKLLAVTALGFLLRLYVVLNAVTIPTDGAGYLHYAEFFASYDFSSGLNSVFPPLYPVMVALFSKIIPDFETAGRTVSLIFGTLVIPVVFCLGRSVYDERVGLVAAFFVAIHPYLVRYSGDTLTEGTYYFIAAVVTLFGLKAVLQRSYGAIFLAGFFSALAYLTRPEGAAFMGLISVWLVLYKISRIRTDYLTRLGLLASGWSVFLVMAVPYMVFVSRDKGSFAVSGKMSLGSLAVQTKGVFFEFGKFLTFAGNIVEAFTIPFFILCVYGLYKVRGGGLRMEERYILTIVGFFAILYLIVLPQRRYLVELMPIALVFSAAGFDYVNKWIKSNMHGRARPAAVALIVLIMAIQVPRCIVSLHAGHLPERLAGEWLKEHKGSGATLMSWKRIVSFYAGADFSKLPSGLPLREVVEYGNSRGVRYLAGYKYRLMEKIPDFESEERLLLEEAASFKGSKDKVFHVYVLPSSG